jgi:hypothetical protein
VIHSRFADWSIHLLQSTSWFSLGTPVSSTNKTDRHDITEILLKVALNTINQTNQFIMYWRKIRQIKSIKCCAYDQIIYNLKKKNLKGVIYDI